MFAGLCREILADSRKLLSKRQEAEEEPCKKPARTTMPYRAQETLASWSRLMPKGPGRMEIDIKWVFLVTPQNYDKLENKTRANSKLWCSFQSVVQYIQIFHMWEWTVKRPRDPEVTHPLLMLRLPSFPPSYYETFPFCQSELDEIITMNSTASCT